MKAPSSHWDKGVYYMRTYRLARFVAILLFLAALIYFVGGAALGAYLWNRGLGDGWGSGFTGWISIPIFITAFFGALTLLMAGAVLYFLALINSNLTKAQQGGVFAEPKPKPVADAPIVPPASRPAPVEPIAIAAPVVAAAPVSPMPPSVEIIAPRLEVAPPVPPAADTPTVVIAAPAVEPASPPDLLAELPDGDADAEVAPQEFTGRLPGVEQAARIATELAAAKGADQPDA